ncbi:hypothetical protein K491DRAFT_757639 [Lophiostoma macrostomum CBS 122681]|uniref:Zn(2)-C6 fungal-type domain-containing protein n=1 Tax=Lophiostoma macrostomum CBS 122681 TaxID=1314788 RepID=A0A6A6TBH8_9PLEO|nr:hypothetical protein K491DRAFT_757639 [Lophiostoma macrostomum CBS 122681]
MGKCQSRHESRFSLTLTIIGYIQSASTRISMGPNDQQEGEEIGAPYGQACTTCATAKRKCLIRPNGKCERCERAGKDCVPIAGTRKRVARKRPSSRRRIRLGGRLDDLVALLRAQQAVGPVDTGILPHLALLADHVSAPGYSSGPISSTQQPSNSTHAINGSHVKFSSASQPDGELALKNFEICYLNSLPFIFLPSSTTAARLQAERPFLWSVILALSAASPHEKWECMQKAQAKLAEEVVVNTRYSIDLLLGVLIASSWPYFLYEKKPPLPLLMNLAATLVYELGIDRPAMGTHANTTPWSRHMGGEKPRTNEDRRALIACFILAST